MDFVKNIEQKTNILLTGDEVTAIKDEINKQLDDAANECYNEAEKCDIRDSYGVTTRITLQRAARIIESKKL